MVWTREVISVVRKILSGNVTAIDYVQRESRRSPFNQIDLPMSQRGVNRTAPVAAPVLTLAEWQIVDNAGGEAIVEVQF